jgi:hypothetical protein
MESWDHLLQHSLKEDNDGLHATITTLSKLLAHITCAWFGSRFCHLRRIFPSDENKIKSGVALCLEDTLISTFLPIADYPIMFIHLKKPIHCEEGYVIYQFTCNLFSHSPNPESLEPPTNLIAIPEYHTHEEAAHLEYEISSLHQQVWRGHMPFPRFALGRTSGALCPLVR